MCIEVRKRTRRGDGFVSMRVTFTRQDMVSLGAEVEGEHARTPGRAAGANS